MSSIRSEAYRANPKLIVHYGQRLSSDLTNEVLSKHARLLLDRLSPEGWDRAGLDILASLTSNDVPHLCNFDPDVLDLGAQDQLVIRQILAYFSKRGDIDLGLDREGAAREKFWRAERSCKVTNDRFRAWGRGEFRFHPEVEAVLHSAQLKISKVLGDAPSLEEIRLRLGPGATTRTPKQNACPLVKLAEDMPACSTNLPVDFLSQCLEPFVDPFGKDVGEGDFSLALLHEDRPVTVSVPVDHGKVGFVPKTAKIDRSICTEPMLNGMFQLGIGDLMADRLRKIGLDIRDQGPNQRAALYGSISGASATLDLSSASDTVSACLVLHLLQGLDEWVDLLFNFRSNTVVDKVEGTSRVYHLEKMSTMGNGFTFPLETLIFWAIAQSCVERHASDTRIRTLVYGDDIVVDTRAALPLAFCLSELGFTVNSKKSFWSGTFRESCGCDYVLGVNVRPIYVTGLIGSDFFRLHNFYRARGDLESAEFFKSWVDPSIAITGPVGFGDGHFHSECYPVKDHDKNGWGGISFESWTYRPKTLRLEIARRLARKMTIRPPVWDGEGWRSGTHGVSVRVYDARYSFVVRRLATYTQYQRSARCLTLTQSDALRSRNRDVYCDRRMPDPITRCDEDFFVVPGNGKVARTRIYIFSPPKD